MTHIRETIAAPARKRAPQVGALLLIMALAVSLAVGAFAAGQAKKKPAPKPGARPTTKPAARSNTAKAPLVPYTETITIPGYDNKTRFDMIPVKGGVLAMADRVTGKQRSVKVAPFWIEKTETTWDEFDQYLIEPVKPKPGTADAVSRPSHPYLPPDRGFGHHGYPVISETAHAAAQYCKWLSLKTGRKYRLPTEAEWELACRAGGPATRPGKEELDAAAWYSANANDTTHPVAQKQPNAWGIYDMLGNAGEWCAGPDGKPVLCGGSYVDGPEKVFCGARVHQTPAWNQTDPQIPKSTWWLSDGPFVGFRVVREP